MGSSLYFYQQVTFLGYISSKLKSLYPSLIYLIRCYTEYLHFMCNELH
ncbi:hypothetical protein VSVS12_04287 [Vibrio scophthalmi]|nr:hypothetical protein VSVS12_04287 [Vibrio scophthalmi]